MNRSPILLESLRDYLENPDIVEILVDGYNQIYADVRGVLTDLHSPYQDGDHLMQEILDMAQSLGGKIDASNPIADFRLPSGERVHVVIPPISIHAPSMTIRKFPASIITMDDLLKYNAITPDILSFIQACILGRINIIMAGGTGSGKTTILNNLCKLIPQDERIITIEHTSELRFTAKRLISLEGRPSDAQGKGEITMRDLVASAVKMRPDRLIIGEVYNGEVIDALQAINTGYDGSMLLIHAISPRDALARLEMMATMGNPSLPLLTIRDLIVSAMQLIIYTERLADGRRKITKITEIVGMQGDTIRTQDIFEFVQTGMEEDRIVGEFVYTGVVPNFAEKIKIMGIELPTIMQE